jgi:hypothetical protein
MTFTGDKDLIRHIENAARNMPKETAKALRTTGEEKVYDPSQELVPVKTGALKASGRIRVTTAESRGVTLKISYGGNGILYAVKIHEDLRLKHPRGGSAKYLERPLLGAKATIGRDLANEIDLRRAVGR